MVKANCSKCRYFIPMASLSDELREKAYEKAGLLGKDVNHILGWCTKKHIPIDHLIDYCNDFEPLHRKHHENMTLSKWLRGG